MILMLSMHMIIYIKVVMSQQVHICTGCKIFLSIFIHTSDMSSIPAISTNHAKILTGLKDGSLRNKLDKSKAKKNGLPCPRFYRM